MEIMTQEAKIQYHNILFHKYGDIKMTRKSISEATTQVKQ